MKNERMTRRLGVAGAARMLALTVMVSLPVLLFGAGKSRGVPGGWYEDFEAAKVAAAKEGKHILMCTIVSDDYWGQKRFKELFSKSSFSGKAKSKFVPMMVDLAKNSKNLSPLAARQNPKLKAEYSLWGYGDGIVVDSDGVVLKRLDQIDGDPKVAWSMIDAATQDLPVAEKKSAKELADMQKAKPSERAAKAETTTKKSKKDAKDEGGRIERIPGTGKSTPLGWMDDFYAAQELAKKDGKWLFVVFSGSDWCGWCKEYSKKVLSVPKFINAMRNRYVLVYIDSPRDKSLITEKCQEQNGQVKQMLGARGGVPHTVIATPDAEKLASINGCNKYAQAGAESFLEYFDKLDEALKAVEKAKNTIREKGLDDDSADAVKIMHDALLTLDEETLVEHFLPEIELVVGKDKAFLHDFPYFEFVYPLETKLSKLKSDLTSAAYAVMESDGQKRSYQAFQAAKRKVFQSEGYRGKFKDLLTEVEETKKNLAGREKTLKSLLNLKTKIYGELNNQ